MDGAPDHFSRGCTKSLLLRNGIRREPTAAHIETYVYVTVSAGIKIRDRRPSARLMPARGVTK
jgi:hypothetical protein